MNAKQRIQVDHIDGNPSNNTVKNLRWVTPSENVNFSYNKNPERKTKSAVGKYKAIRCINSGKEYASSTVAAKELGLFATNITAVLKGRKKHVKTLKFEYVPQPDLDGEIWKQHPDLGISVSNMGRITTCLGVKTFGCLESNGYMKLNIKGKRFHAHRIVAETFVENKSSKPCVCHIDHNRSNNKVKNLKWLDKSECFLHSHKSNKKRKTNAAKRSRKIRCIETNEIFKSSVEAATLMNLSQPSVSACARGKQKEVKGFRFEYAPQPDFDGEIWKQRPDLGISVSNMGRILTKTGMKTFGSKQKTNYYTISLPCKKSYMVHRLVAETFLQP
jgi:hypothetical protein